EVLGCQHHPAGAEPALLPLVVPERLLNRMQRAVGIRHALDRLDTAVVRLNREHYAGPDRLSVDLHGASAADPVLAPEMGAGQVEILAQKIPKASPDLDLALMYDAVDLDAHKSLRRQCGFHAHDPSPPISSRAWLSARRVRTPHIWRR